VVSEASNGAEAIQLCSATSLVHKVREVLKLRLERPPQNLSAERACTLNAAASKLLLGVSHSMQ